MQPKKPRPHVSNAERDRITELITEGYSLDAVAREVGRSIHAVQRVVARQGNNLENVEPWRCSGCGGMVRLAKCLACQFNKTGRLGRRQTSRLLRRLFARARREGRPAASVEVDIYGEG